ncbi:MAG: hypothetical protein P4L27_10875 [Ignavibacteriaceae bacterium]|nr:hypothetical protein [Ignavibacteriaceae bacterium]
MKLKSFVLFVVAFSNILFGWGDQGHKLINNKAVALLPAEMQDFTKWKDYITLHSVDPDNRKKDDKSEAPKHFIDIDFYKEFNAGKMIENKKDLVAIYGDSMVTKQGLLPWATLDTYNKLIQAFKDKKKDAVLLYTSDLGHYVGDGHQPMHTMLNYNGQLTNQKGVHARYEIKMVDKYIKEIEASITKADVKKINDPFQYIFDYIANANSVQPVLLDADLYAAKSAGSNDNDEYLRLMWFKTRYVTEIQFNTAVTDFASLIYSAWIEAGKPDLSGIQ